MRTLEELQHVPGSQMTAEELAIMPPDYQEYVRKFQANQTREAACPGHEPEDQGSYEDHRRGWHPAKCKHCGTDMSRDSSG